jgi:hypothetical protein
METINFDEWIDRIFDHPVDQIPYYYDQDRNLWSLNATPEVTFDFMTGLFENPVEALNRFTDLLLWGLHYIAKHSPSEKAYLSLSTEERERAVNSFYTLFEKLFAVRCTAHLSTEHEGRSPLNTMYILWWYRIPISAESNNPDSVELHMMYMDVMNKVLQLDSEPCQESALTGLGNFSPQYPEKASGIIDAYLLRNPRPELKTYAQRARIGFWITDKTRYDLIEKIERAFANTQYPGDENIANKDHCGECEELYLQFKGKHWSELTDVEFLRYHNAGLSLFNPEAFRFYLPAYMRAALVDRQTADVIVDSLQFHLMVPENTGTEAEEWLRNVGVSLVSYFLGKVTGFNAEQREAIRAYLELDARLSFMWDTDRVARRERTQHYWSTGIILE